LRRHPSPTLFPYTTLFRSPSDVTVYNEVNPPEIRWLEKPVVTDQVPGIKQAFERHMVEHPILAHHIRTGDGSARKISDFLSRGQDRKSTRLNSSHVSISYA